MVSGEETPASGGAPDVGGAPLEGTRVLVVFGAIPLLGQEKGNLQVFEALRPLGLDCRFITHRSWGHQAVQPELDRLGFAWGTAPFGPRIGRGMGVRQLVAALWGILGTNLALGVEILRYRPTHLYAMNPLYVIYATPLIFLLRTPLVYRLGDLVKGGSRASRAFWRLLARRVSRLICITDFILGEAAWVPVPAEKLRRIYNTAPVSRAAPARRGDGAVTLAVQHNHDGYHTEEEVVIEPAPGVLTCVYAGQISEHKGVHLAVEVILRLLAQGAPVRLLLAGNYTYRNDFADGLRRRVEEAGQGGGVRWLGYVKDVPALLALGDLHLFPSVWQEPLGNSILEAKAAGIPSVVFPLGGMPEVVEHGVDGWLCGRPDAAALEEAVRFYLDHPGETRTQGEAARRSAEGRFGLGRFQREWQGVFRRVAPGGEAPSGAAEQG